MRLALAQIDPTVGAFDANVAEILRAYERAEKAGCRMLLTPELTVCGYPPHDLLTRPEIFERNETALAQLTQATKGKKCALIAGHVARNPSKTGRLAQNAVSVLENGKVVHMQAKTLLPTYDVFDEARYFEPAQEIKLWVCDGKKIAIGICEDFWGRDPSWGRQLYGADPIEQYKKQGAEIMLSASASPYEWGKRERREAIHQGLAKELGVPLVYVNQIGATDEVLFDGESFVADARGHVVGRLPAFRKSFAVLEWGAAGKIEFIEPTVSQREDTEATDMEVLTRGLICGIQEYFSKTGFKKAIIGLSGGVDSAVVGTLATLALGRENVTGVAMASQFSSSHSLEDAEALAQKLGIRLDVQPIKFAYSTLSRELAGRRGALGEIALENLQSRLRGLILMTYANHDGALVLTTGNKSEIATGYCTLYGDMVGALAPIGDLLKTRVYDLARHLRDYIPERSITKAPSAELKPGQLDQDTLPPYDKLDALIEDSIEKGLPSAELVKKHGAWAKDILRRIEINEYKRRQAAPILKVSHKAFGIGRRVPIAKTWDQSI